MFFATLQASFVGVPVNACFTIRIWFRERNFLSSKNTNALVLHSNSLRHYLSPLSKVLSRTTSHDARGHTVPLVCVTSISPVDSPTDLQLQKEATYCATLCLHTSQRPLPLLGALAPPREHRCNHYVLRVARHTPSMRYGNCSCTVICPASRL